MSETKCMQMGLIAALMFVASEATQAGVLDDFSDGNDDGWTHATVPLSVAGTWDASDGEYHLFVDQPSSNATIGSALDITNDPAYQDGCFSARVRRHNGATGFAVFMRIDPNFDGDPQNGYLFIYVEGHGMAIIKGLEGGGGGPLANDPIVDVPLNTEFIVEGCIVGGELEMRWWRPGLCETRPDEPQLAATDPDPHPAGVHGVLASISPGFTARVNARFDDVTFVPAGAACSGDLNSDGVVSLADLTLQLANFGVACGATAQQGDVDNDGDVDLADLSTLLSAFGAVCP